MSRSGHTYEEVDLLEGHHLAGCVAQIVPQPVVLAAGRPPLQPLVVPVRRGATVLQSNPADDA